MKLWGNSGGRTEDRNPPPAQQRPSPRQPARPAAPGPKTTRPAQPGRSPAQPRPTSGKEPFEIDWDAVWKREAELRRLRQQGNHSQDGQIPDFVLRSQAGRVPAPPKGAVQPKTAAKGKPKKKKKSHWLRNTLLCLMMLAGLYCVAVFSNIPFIAKWRTIYIETAMSTMTHQWLATAFIPPSVIEKVESNREKQESEQLDLESNWGNISTPSFDFSRQPELSTWEKLKEDFFQNYPEIQRESFESYMEEHQQTAIDENGYLAIDEAGLDQQGTDIETIHGDQVLAVDTANGLTICRVEIGRAHV